MIITDLRNTSYFEGIEKYNITFVSKSYMKIKDNIYKINDNLDFTVGLLSAESIKKHNLLQNKSNK